MVGGDADTSQCLDVDHFFWQMRWNLDGPDGQQHYWRDMLVSIRQTNGRQTGHPPIGGSVMVWGGFSGVGKIELAILVGNQKLEDYIYKISAFCSSLIRYRVSISAWQRGHPYFFDVDGLLRWARRECDGLACSFSRFRYDRKRVGYNVQRGIP